MTLAELLVALAILALVTGWAVPRLDTVLVRQSLVAHANQLAALIHGSRGRAIGRAPILICSRNERCATFLQPADGLLLVYDLNDNGRLDASDEVELGLDLPRGMTVTWRSFRGRPWLRIDRRGVAYYQNGHFLLCYRNHGRKVIVNYQALPRVEAAPDGLCPA